MSRDPAATTSLGRRAYLVAKPLLMPSLAARHVTGLGPRSMTAMSCVDGRYYAVLVTAPRLRLDNSLQAKLHADLRVVEEKLRID